MTEMGQERRIGAVRNIPRYPPRADVGADIVEPPVSAIADVSELGACTGPGLPQRRIWDLLAADCDQHFREGDVRSSR